MLDQSDPCVSHQIPNYWLLDQILMYLFTGHAQPIRSLCFSPDSQLLVTGSDINVFILQVMLDQSDPCVFHQILNYWLLDQIIMYLITGHARPIRSLCFSPDSQLLVTGSDINVFILQVMLDQSDPCVFHQILNYWLLDQILMYLFTGHA